MLEEKIEQPTPQVKRLLITIRQALIMVLGAIENFLGMERSITPKRKRDKH